MAKRLELESASVEGVEKGDSVRSLKSLIQTEDVTKDTAFSNLSHWISCFCVVTFDLELGQALEVVALCYMHYYIYIYIY